MGLDFAILYPAASRLFAPYVGDEALRIAGWGAFNRYAAETWAAYSDRVTPIGNAVKLWASLNLDSFTGTVAESQVRKPQARTGQA
jgi:hypothetical protein